MRCLVTGAAGFTGRHLARMLTALGHDVTGTGRREPEAGDAPWQRFVKADLGSAAAVRQMVADERPDVVFHLAGVLRGTEAELLANNSKPVEHLCKAAAAAKTPVRLVLAGSSAEYGPGTFDGPPFDETSPCAPTLPYGKSKLLATQHALLCAEKNGLEVRIARPSNLLGAGLSTWLVAGSLVAQLAECVQNGRPLVVRAGDLTAQRDFVDVEDVCRGYLALATHTGPRRIFNFAADHCFPIRTLVDILQHEVAAPIDVLRDPELMRPGSADRVAITAAAAAAELGFRRHVSLRESIARMWQAAIEPQASELTS